MNKDSTKITFGGRQALALCNMSHGARLDFIAEGLPVIVRSARGFWQAARALAANPREASVLEGFAEEESAKALILIDLVRCPVSVANTRIGGIVKGIFYDHLARMIYAKAQGWMPVDISQLQEYVDHERQGHYLEGDMSEYIVPNWSLYQRESTMYADIEVHEDGVPQWNDPNRWAAFSSRTRPIALDVVEALDALGIFTRAGLQAASDVWGQVNFVDNQDRADAVELTGQLGARLESEGLLTKAATDEHRRVFYHFWQLPMYNLAFDLIRVPLEELEAQRQATYWNEVGGY